MNLIYKSLITAATLTFAHTCQGKVNKLVKAQSIADSAAIEILKEESKELMTKHLKHLSIDSDKYIKN
jgi:hypothetical protein